MKQINDKPLTYQELCKIRNRMCKQVKYINHEQCGHCPIWIHGGVRGRNCYELVTKHPELAEPILKKWAAEHPVKTNKDKFVEVFGRPDFRDKSCVPFCADSEATPCSGCDWWNDEYVEPEETDE